MRLIGGLVHRDSARALPGSSLTSMAAAVPGAAVDLALARAAGFFSSLGDESLRAGDRVSAVVDADLTNHDELVAFAGAAKGDAELVAALYEREGAAFVRRLRGAFAVAVWDPRQRRLLLAVDPLGIRRLMYVAGPDRIAFASRAVALAAAAPARPDVDLTSIYNYLSFAYVPGPRTAFAGVHRLPPGHMLLSDATATRIERYWDLDYRRRPRSLHAAGVELYRATDAAVRRAVNGVCAKHLGAFLSGGTDSSTVLGLMAAVAADKPSAFSIGFSEERYDELRYAELSARHFGAAHYARVIKPEDAFAAVPRLVEAYDEPFGNNSAIGTLFCAQLASECGVRTLLAGDGGDEIFGGNERYTTDHLFARYHRLPRFIRRSVLEPVLFGLPNGGPRTLERARRYVTRANIPNPQRFYSYEFFFLRERERMLDPAFVAAVDVEAPHAVLEEHYRRVPAEVDLERLMYLDLKLTIADNDLLKVTRTCELAGVDVRFPLLDYDLVQLTATWPASFKVRGAEKRYLFKRAFRSLLPSETLAKRKHGFGVPTSTWLRADRRFAAFARETLLGSRARQRGYFRQGAIEELFRLHAGDTTPYYGDILWSVLMLELWHQRHTDGAAAA